MTTVPRLFAISLLVAAAGCTRYQVRTLPPPEGRPGFRPRRARDAA